MSDFIERLTLEKDELNKKQHKLKEFLSSETFQTVDYNQRRLLII